jgi:tetratricopeptide (TPR) repeat protein
MRRRMIIVVVIVLAIIMPLALAWLFSIRIEPTSAGHLNTVRDALLSVLQIMAILLLLGVIVTFVRWLSRKAEGTVVLPFDLVMGEDKDHRVRYNGKSISDSLTAELLRIFEIHKKQEEDQKKQEEDQKKQEEDQVNNPQIAPSGPDTLGAPGYAGRGEEPHASPAVERPKPNILFAGPGLKTAGEKLNPSFADVATIGLGGATVSIGRLLIALKQLWTDRDPECIISGSLQKFGPLVRLVAHLERRGDRSCIWEVSHKIESDDEIPNVLKDLAFKIWQDIPTSSAKTTSSTKTTSSAKTWVGLKYFTEALDGYRKYTLTGRAEDLEHARTNCLAAAQAEQGYQNLFRVCYNLGNAYFEIGDYEKAEELFTHAINIHRGASLERDALERVADAFNGLGASLANQKKYAEAESFCRRAIKLNPRYLQAYSNLSFILAERGRLAEAKIMVLKAVELGLLPPAMRRDLGDWCAGLGLKSEAIDAYKGAIKLDPKDVNSHHNLGNLYADLSRTDDAIAEYQRAIELQPEFAPPHNDLGIIYANLGRTDDAIAEYKRAIELDPEFGLPHNNLGLIYDDLGRTDDAIAEFRRAIELDPTLPVSHTNLGIIYARLGLQSEAIAAYESAIELDLNNPYVHSLLGDLYARLGRTDDAIAEFQRAITLDPGNAYVYSSLAYVYLDLGRNDEAIATYQHAIELDPNVADFHVGLADVYVRLGRYDEAIAAYRRAIELDPKKPLALASLAACYRRLGREAEYVQQVKIARELTEKWTDDEYNGACFEALCGNVDEALALLKVALEKKQLTPDHAHRDTDFDFIREDPRFKALLNSSIGLESTQLLAFRENGDHNETKS